MSRIEGHNPIYETLQVIDDEELISVNRISTILGVRSGTIYSSVHRLKLKGLIESNGISEYRLTDKGKVAVKMLRENRLSETYTQNTDRAITREMEREAKPSHNVSPKIEETFETTKYEDTPEPIDWQTEYIKITNRLIEILGGKND